jgi:hypothetical protein
VNPAARKRHVNDLIRAGLRHQSPDEPIAFFCECDEEHCHQIVWLTGPEYDRARHNPRWIALLPGHTAAAAADRTAAGVAT